MAKNPEQMESEPLNPNTPAVDAAARNLIGAVKDERVNDRYPNRTHLIAADLPDHGKLATEALFAGDPVALVYPDGREVLMTPEHARGIAGLFLIAAVFWLKVRSKQSDDTMVQMPPRTRIEARGSKGMPVAA